MTTSPSVLATKLFPPPARPDAVARPHLIDRLSEGVDRPLTLVAAPAGFGKTTLVAQWLAGAQERVAWVSLDEADRDPIRFLTYLVEAVRTAWPGFAPGLVGALRSTPPAPTESLLTLLINDAAALEGRTVVVLDDYHVVDGGEVDDLLAFLVDHLPPGVRLVLTTRADPRLPLARYRARGRLSEIRAADLRFTPEEAGAFLRRSAGLSLSAAGLAVLDERTEGWIAGLQLVALSLRGQEDVEGFLASFGGSHRFVLDYLVEEVLQRQPERVQAFLLRTSILDRMCGALCDAVLRDDATSGQAMLEAIDAANLFVVPLDHERRWYRYHHLFRELLRQRLRGRLTGGGNATPGEVELHGRASRWFEGAGLRIEAFRHAAAAGDVARAERLVDGAGMPLHLRESAPAVLDWLRNLAPEVLNERPSLWALYAQSLSFVGRNVAAAEKLGAAEAALRGAGPGAANGRLLGRIATLRATMAVMQGDAATILAESVRALEHLPHDAGPDRAAATWTLGYGHQLRGERDAARRAHEEVLTLDGSPEGSLYTLAAALALGQLDEADAHLTRAARHYERVVHLAGDPPQLIACEAHLGLARVAYERDDLRAAREHAHEGLRLANRTDGLDTFASCCVLLARLRTAVGDLPGATAVLQEAEAFVHRHGFTHRLADVAAQQAAVLLHQERPDDAWRRAEGHDLPLTLVRVHLARGAAGAALAALATWEAGGGADAPGTERLRGTVLRAVALAAAGDDRRAERAMDDALRSAEAESLLRPFLDEGPGALRVVRASRDRGEAPRFAERVLAAFDGPTADGRRGDAPPPAAAGLGLHEPLSERELEILRLIAQGLSNREIAERLFRAVDTVKGHGRRIYAKLEVRSRTEAVARARDLGLL